MLISSRYHGEFSEFIYRYVIRAQDFLGMTTGQLLLEALRSRDILVSAPLAGGSPGEESGCIGIATRGGRQT